MFKFFICYEKCLFQKKPWERVRKQRVRWGQGRNGGTGHDWVSHTETQKRWVEVTGGRKD